jgi:hypothetical protein
VRGQRTSHFTANAIQQLHHISRNKGFAANAPPAWPATPPVRWV